MAKIEKQTKSSLLSKLIARAVELEKERDTLDKLHREACDHTGRLTSQVTELTRQRDTFERQALESGKRLDEARNVIADMTIAHAEIWKPKITVHRVAVYDPDQWIERVKKLERDDASSRIAAVNDLKRELERALIDLRIRLIDQRLLELRLARFQIGAERVSL